ncbi:MAG TPA: hypothetical protein VNN76_04225 [Bacteroidota bacterium]|nr:hypothetical protein [Bacteroidota bacterium]
MQKPKFENYFPFDLYDFFGYLFPGLMVIVYLVFFDVFLSHESGQHVDAIVIFVENLPWFLGLFLTIAFVLTVYVFGHLIGAIGSIVLDRIFMEGIYGYPVVWLLSLRRESHEYAEATHRYIFVASQGIILSCIFFSDYRTFRISFLIFTAVIIAFILFRIFIRAFKSAHLGPLVSRVAGNKFVRWFLLSPSNVIIWIEDNLVKPVLGMEKPLPHQFRNVFFKLFQKVYGMDPKNKLSSENYWLSYHYATARNPASINLLKTWLHLYAFARNISVATYLCLFGFVIYRFYRQLSLSWEVQLLLIVMLFVSWVFLIRYWVLHQNYHTKNVLRAFVTAATMDFPAAKEKTRS